MSNRVNIKLDRNPPYQDTEVPYERTKAEIEFLLKSYGVKGIRWTALEGQEDLLEFVIEAEVAGVRKQLGIAARPPHIYIKKKLHGQIVNTENINQEYRLLFHWLKSKIEAVVWALSTVEKEFLSEVRIKPPDGRSSTIGEVVIDLIGKDSMQSLPFYGEPKNEPTHQGPRNITHESEMEAPQ